MTIEVVGLPTVLAGFAAKLEQMATASPAAFAEGAEVIRDAWVANIEEEPLILTGHYRDSVHVETDGEEVAVLTDLPYPRILEFGDSRQAAHPVAERAFDEHHEDATERIAERLRSVVG